MSTRRLAPLRSRTTLVDFEARAAHVKIMADYYALPTQGGFHGSPSSPACRRRFYPRVEPAAGGRAKRADPGEDRPQPRSLRRFERALPPRRAEGILRAGEHRRDDVALEERHRRDPAGDVQ